MFEKVRLALKAGPLSKGRVVPMDQTLWLGWAPSSDVHIKFFSECSTTTAILGGGMNLHSAKAHALFELQQRRVFEKLSPLDVAMSVVMPYGVLTVTEHETRREAVAWAFPAVVGFKRGFPVSEHARFSIL